MKAAEKKVSTRAFLADLVGPLREVDRIGWFLGVGSVLLVIFWQVNHRAGFFLRYLAPQIANPVLIEWGRYFWYHLWALILLGILPTMVVVRWGKMSLRDLGFGLGDRQAGRRFLLLGIAIATPLILLNSFDPAFQREYPLTKLAGSSVSAFIIWELVYALYYLGWEPYFRGTLLFGLKDRIGALGAIFFQTAISCFVHIGKPPGEFASSLVAGFFFGAVALRLRSFWWIFVLHWYLGALTDLACLLQVRGLGIH